MNQRKRQQSRFSGWYLLLLLPFLGTLFPALYSAEDPAFAGIPFFYWYQFLWVIISAVLTWIVYLATNKK